MAWTDPKTWSTNDVLSASDLNTYLRDNERAIGKLTSYTPVWTASTTNPAIGNGTIQGRYIALEEWCYVNIMIVCGTTTTGGGGVYTVTLPFAAASLIGGAGEQSLRCHFNRYTVARYNGVALLASGATSFGVSEISLLSASTAGAWGTTTPFTFASVSNVFYCEGIYRRV